MNLVTTLPSATEIACALGLEPVGVSHECDYPPRVLDHPSVTRSRIDTDGSSAAIDEQVLEAADDESGEGVYEIDHATLEALDPDLIVTQGMCDVCAVDTAAIERAVDAIEAEPDLLTTDPHSVADVFADVERIGRAAGVEQRARTVIDDLEGRIDAVRDRTTDIDASERPRVAIFDWTNPVMIAGHWTTELVEWAGGRYGLADVGERSRPRQWDEIRDYDPEVVIVAPCGFDLAQTAENLADLADREGWDELSAVEEGRIWALDGDQYLNRPGPRLVDTLELLAPIIQPERFDERPSTDVAVPWSVLRADYGATA
ncbi:ABC transporter substrate-binding protein [Natrialbaceae archaeon A-CW1-1]